MASFLQKLWPGVKKNSPQVQQSPATQEDAKGFDYSSITRMPVRQRPRVQTDQQLSDVENSASGLAGVAKRKATRKRKAGDIELGRGQTKRLRQDTSTNPGCDRKATSTGIKRKREQSVEQQHFAVKKTRTGDEFQQAADQREPTSQIHVHEDSFADDDVHVSAQTALQRQPASSVADADAFFGPARFRKSPEGLRKKAKQYLRRRRLTGAHTYDDRSSEDRLRGIGLWPGSDNIPGAPAVGMSEEKSSRVPHRLSVSMTKVGHLKGDWEALGSTQE